MLFMNLYNNNKISEESKKNGTRNEASCTLEENDDFVNCDEDEEDEDEEEDGDGEEGNDASKSRNHSAFHAEEFLNTGSKKRKVSQPFKLESHFTESILDLSVDKDKLKFKETGGVQSACKGVPRIFNLDAFCNICNRELCNKYFLKTHKANKHGIYDVNSIRSYLSNYFLGFNKTSAQPSSPYPPTSFDEENNKTHFDNLVKTQLFTQSTLINSCSFCHLSFKSCSDLHFHVKSTHCDTSAKLFNVNSILQSPKRRKEDIFRSEAMKKSDSIEVKNNEVSSTINSSRNREKVEKSPPTTCSSRQSKKDKNPLIDAVTSFPFNNYGDGERSLEAQLMTSYLNARSNPLSAMKRLNSVHPTTPIIVGNSFCHICQKELCNKYFLKTHLCKMHGINIEDRTQILFPTSNAINSNQNQNSSSIPSISFTPSSHPISTEQVLAESKDFHSNSKFQDGNEKNSSEGGQIREAPFPDPPCNETFDKMDLLSLEYCERPRAKRGKENFTVVKKIVKRCLKSRIKKKIRSLRRKAHSSMKSTRSHEKDSVSSFLMQAFIITPRDRMESRVLPSVLYLPVSKKINREVTLLMKLKPTTDLTKILNS